MFLGPRHRVSAALAALTLVAVTLVAAPSAVAAPAKKDPAVPVAWNEHTPCQDVLFLGARGSGQSGDDGPDGRGPLGPEVNYVLDRYLEAVPGYDVAWAAVNYTAQDVKVLLPTIDTTPAYRLRLFFGGLSDGVQSARDMLERRHHKCTNERVVLAGYSQGAMLMHRLLLDIQQQHGITEALAWVDGAILIADGDRTRFPDDVHLLGTAQRPQWWHWHPGVSWASQTLSGARDGQFDWQFAHRRVVSVCIKGDIVCDHEHWIPVPHLDGGHTRYLSTMTRELTKAAKMIADRTDDIASVKTWPVPLEWSYGGEWFSTGEVGREYSHTMAVTGGRPPYTVTVDPATLPAGLSFDTATMTLAGTPLVAGVSSPRITVTDSRKATLVTDALLEVRPAPATTPTVDGVVLLSADEAGAATGDAYYPRADDTGRWVAFLSGAAPFTDYPGEPAVVVADTAAGTRQTLWAPQPAPEHGLYSFFGANAVDISADGSTVAFHRSTAVVEVEGGEDTGEVSSAFTGSSGELYVVDRATGQVLLRVATDRQYAELHLSADGQRVLVNHSISGDGFTSPDVVVYDVPSGVARLAPMVTATGEPVTMAWGMATALEVSRDGRFAYFTTHLRDWDGVNVGAFGVWRFDVDANTTTFVAELPETSDEMNAGNFSADRNLLTYYRGGGLRVLNVTTGAVTAHPAPEALTPMVTDDCASYSGHPSGAVSNDGTRFYVRTCTDLGGGYYGYQLSMWDTTTGAVTQVGQTRLWDGHLAPVGDLAGVVFAGKVPGRVEADTQDSNVYLSMWQ